MTATEVKAARSKLRLTQEELATKLKRSSRTIIKWEKCGITKIADALALHRLVRSAR